MRAAACLELIRMLKVQKWKVDLMIRKEYGDNMVRYCINLTVNVIM